MGSPEIDIDANALHAWRDGAVGEPTLYQHIPVKLRTLMEIVASTRGLSMAVIRGRQQAHTVVNARSVIAVLAQQFLPRMTMASIEDGMLRGSGMVDYYRLRHRDRLELYAEYAALYKQCLAAVEARRSDFFPHGGITSPVPPGSPAYR